MDADRPRPPQGRRWVKGQSGNLRGRPKGSEKFREDIRKRTRNGRELIDHAMRALTDPKSSDAAQAAARAFLADRWLGKPVQPTTAEVTASIEANVVDVASMPPDLLREVFSLTRRLAESEARTIDVTPVPAQLEASSTASLANPNPVEVEDAGE